MMDDHQQLKSKYERLCVEFKKLRTKYKTLKDNENELNQQLHEEILQKNLHIEKLKQEIEQLKQSLNNPIVPINGITYENSTKLSLLLNDNSSQLSCPTDTVAKKSITTQEINNDFNQTKLSDTTYKPIYITKHNSFSITTNDYSTNSILSSPSDNCHHVAVDTHNNSSKSLLSSLSSLTLPSSSSSLLLEDTLMTTKSTVSVASSSTSTTSTSTTPTPTTSTTSTTSATPSSSTTSTSSTTTTPPTSTSTTSTTSTTMNLPSSSDQDWRSVIDVEEELIQQFIQLLNNWINSIKTNQNISIIDKDKLDHILMNRITELESQLCEITLRYQLEHKRRLKSETKDDSKLMAHSSQASNSNDLDPLSNSSNEKSDENSNAHKVIMKRLHTAIEESIYYASRANFLQDELESLIPWIIQLLYFYQKQQSKYHIIKQSNEQLKQQLELIKTNTIKQINEMAKHINHLTNELQTLQLNSLSKHHNHLMNEQSQWNGLTNDNQVKKNTLFNILKK
ncbi:unnamed protein product [Schistosoma rodhaini]|uniref:GRIP domain-containing protein n=1 Tax=Schistosoma rodhaini TaxID=6188 RepID=A0AA85FE79_9TREM|nr:unnamed protein product [Schistosoma rodhaini]CAH8532314.1 unnamed protein product [Schistosoma rodhaini]